MKSKTRKSAILLIFLIIFSVAFFGIYFTPVFYSVVWTLVHKRTLTLEKVKLDVPFLWSGKTPYKWNKESVGLEKVSLLRADTQFKSQRKFVGSVFF